MPAKQPTYLLATADPDLPARVGPEFAAAGVRLTEAASAEAALAVMAGANPPDLVLLDAELPGMPVAELLAAVRSGEAAVRFAEAGSGESSSKESGSGEPVSAETGPRLPIVLIARRVTQEWLDRLDDGVLDDLIPRQDDAAYWQLRAASVLREYRLLYELGHLREKESRNAQLDRLTGVYNREALLSLLFRETDRVQRMSSRLTVLMFDVDDFGHWNSRLGLDACDEMLCQMVKRVARLLRSYDLLGRTGKDEFLIALPGCTVANAMTLAERLRLEVFSVPYRSAAAESVRLSASFGIAESLGRSPVVVLREAEQALARAKETGPEAIQVFANPQRPTPAPVTFLSSDSGEELLAW